MDSPYRAITAQAWAGMLFLLLTMFIADLVRLSIEGEFAALTRALAADPGRTGLWILVLLICANTLIQVAIRTFQSPAFRWFLFAASVLYTAFFVAHQIAHVAGGESFGLHTFLDLTHHALGFWACWASWQWARTRTQLVGGASGDVAAA